MAEEQKPRRIQRKRTKGWRMPEGTIAVSRPSRYGNPFVIGGHYRKGDMAGGGGIGAFVWTRAADGYQDSTYTTIKSNAEAADWFRWYVTTWSDQYRAEIATALLGRNLACWCSLDQPCHADVLLELANT